MYYTASRGGLQGGFAIFAYLSGFDKASPFGRGVTEGDGEGKDAAKQLLHSDSIALTKNLLIAAQKLFCPGLALSVSLRSPALPEGEPLACRSAFVWTSKARCPGNGSALLPKFTAA